MNDQQRDDRQFAISIRREFSDDSELCASLKTFGWHPELPALVDEHGAVLIGNRRLKIAEDQGINPVIKTITFGDGKEADVERLKLALLSNLGSAPFTPKDRKRIAEYLYGERGWTMARIGEALNVSQRQISSDLSNLEVTSKLPREEKRGRPKSEPKPPREPKIAPAKKEAAAQAYLDHGKSRPQVAAEFGISEGEVRVAVEYEKGRREAPIDPESLPKSAQEKLHRAIKQAVRKLEADFERRVQEGIKQAIEETVLPHYNKKMDQYDEVIKARKGVVTSDEYRLILSCLHPDRVADAGLKELFSRAFNAFKSHELALRGEKEMPTQDTAMPRNYAEWQKMRDQVRAARKHQRQQSNGLQRQ